MTEGATTAALNVDAVEPHLAPLRAAFQADGADLRVASVAGSEVTLELVVTEETCLDCIVAPPLLAAMVGDAITTALPGVTNVVVNDPRA